LAQRDRDPKRVARMEEGKKGEAGAMDTFFRLLLGKPAHCFANMHGGGPPAKLESMRAMDQLVLKEGADKTFKGLSGECGAGNKGACLVAGLMAMEGQGTMQNLDEAAGLLQKACDLKVPQACFYLGRLRDGLKGFDGKGLPADAGKAYEHYRQGCSGGSGEACYNVGQMLDNGRVVDGEEKKLHARVAKFFGLACTNGVARGCVNLGAIKYEGTQIRQDHKGALQLFKRACELGEGAGCGHAGSMLLAGEGVSEPATSEAAELYYEGCRLGHSRSCLTQGKMLSSAAAEAIEKGSATAEHALHAKARGVMFYRRACELGDPQGCKIYRNAQEGLKEVDTRTGDEVFWLNVNESKDEAK